MSTVQDSDLVQKIKNLGPWHQIIEITPGTTTSAPVNDSAIIREKKEGTRSVPTYQPVPSIQNDGVSLSDFRPSFFDVIQKVYPDGLQGKSVLDCACNAGGYCFWSKELGARQAFGFDVREHWIDQAQFVRNHRTVGDVDGIHFEVRNLYDIDASDCESADVTLFKGIFYHLPLPMRAIQLAVDKTDETFWFNTASSLEGPDGLLQLVFEGDEDVMSGVHQLSWLPTGPKVMAKLLRSIGFESVQLMLHRSGESRWNERVHKNLDRNRARFELIAHRESGKLAGLQADSLEYFDEGYFVPQRLKVSTVMASGANLCEAAVLAMAKACKFTTGGFYESGVFENEQVESTTAKTYGLHQVTCVSESIITECDAVVLPFAGDVNRVLDRAQYFFERGVKTYKFDVLAEFSVRRALRWIEENDFNKLFVDASRLDDGFQEQGACELEKLLGCGKRIDEFLVDDSRIPLEHYQSPHSAGTEQTESRVLLSMISNLLFWDLPSRPELVEFEFRGTSQESEVVVLRDPFEKNPFPIEAIKMAADQAERYLVLGTEFASGFPDGYLAPDFERSFDNGFPLWLPTGSRTIVQILYWLGFQDVRLLVEHDDIRLSQQRLEFVAGRKVNSLRRLHAVSRRFDRAGKLCPPRK